MQLESYRMEFFQVYNMLDDNITVLFANMFYKVAVTVPSAA